MALQSLASARSDEARQALFERMASLALDPGSKLKAEERHGVDRLMANLLRYVERSVRSHLAVRMAKLDDPPRAVLRALAVDDIAVAKPIITNSPALDDQTLIDIAREGSHEHRLAVAARPHVSAAVTEAVIDLDDLEISECVVGNETAAIAPAALNRLASQSEHSDSLRQALLARPDLPPLVAHRMFWWVSGAVRRHILERHAVDVDQLNELLEGAVKDGLLAISHDAAVKRVVDAINSHARGPLSNLIHVLRKGSIDNFTISLCDRLGVDLVTARRIVGDAGGESFAVACKAMDADRGQFTSMYLLLDFKRNGRARPPAALTHLTSIYDRVSRSKATASIALWETLETQSGTSSTKHGFTSR